MRVDLTGPIVPPFSLVIAALLWAASSASALDSKDAPRITAIAPISVTPGAQVTLKIRGVKLDAATEARFPSRPELKVELKEKKKADLPNGLEAKDVGDTQCEATLTLPADLPAGPLAIEIVTPKGASEPREIAVSHGPIPIEEKEPNNGFAEAQSIELGKLISGRVKEDRDVDVFALQTDSSQALAIEITAARRSSLLDPLVSIFDEKRRLLRVIDDAETRDPVFTFAPPAAGKYFIVVQDAGDRGGAWHNYELLVKPQP
jgi:hypothetical protein